MTNRFVKRVTILILFVAAAAEGSPRQDATNVGTVQAAAQAKADQDAAVAAQQRAEQIQDLYAQIRRIEDDRRSAEANVHQTQTPAAPAAYTPSKDPTVAAQQAAAQAAAQAIADRADYARSALADSTERIQELTNEIEFLEGGLPIGSIDPGMDYAGSGKQAGTWKLDLVKSEFSGPVPKAETEKIAVVEGGLKSIDDRINSDGTRTRIEWTARYDAKSYAVKGGSNRPAISLWQADDGSLQFVRWEAGKMTAKGRIVCSPDGKSRTVNTTVINSQGKQVTAIAVWTKQ